MGPTLTPVSIYDYIILGADDVICENSTRPRDVCLRLRPGKTASRTDDLNRGGFRYSRTMIPLRVAAFHAKFAGQFSRRISVILQGSVGAKDTCCILTSDSMDGLLLCWTTLRSILAGV